MTIYIPDTASGLFKGGRKKAFMIGAEEEERLERRKKDLVRHHHQPISIPTIYRARAVFFTYFLHRLSYTA